jgi:uncharacterized protein YjiS (DUF1127 family)
MEINIPDRSHQCNSFCLSISHTHITGVDTTRRTFAMSAYIALNRTTPINKLRPGPGPFARAAAAFKAFGHEFRRALRVMATRPDVSKLDDRMLQDLGISRAQAEFEASRGAWRTR